MASVFPNGVRTANTIPPDVTETQPLVTGDLFNHPINGLQYIYTEPPGGGTNSQDYWTVVNTIVSSDYVLVSGDIMTGDLTLSADPTQDLHAATKQYVDNVESAIIPFIIALG